MIGEKEAEACIFIVDAASEFERQHARGTLPPFSWTQLGQGLMRLKQVQELPPAQAPQTRSSQLAILGRRDVDPRDVDPYEFRSRSSLAHLLWLCAALYGKMFNQFIGTFRELPLGGLGEPFEADFFRYVVEQKYTGLVLDYHRDELNLDEEGVPQDVLAAMGSRADASVGSSWRDQAGRTTCETLLHT